MNIKNNNEISHLEDKTTTISEIKNLLEKFVIERDWIKFHTPKNLIMALSVEVAELMEKFQWVNQENSNEILYAQRQEIENEVADVFGYLLRFASVCHIDIARSFAKKLVLNCEKYPLAKVDGTFENIINLKKEFKDSHE